MSRLLGIDYGEKRVGVAFTDEAGQMAFPLTVFPNDKNLFKISLMLLLKKKLPKLSLVILWTKKGSLIRFMIKLRP